MTAQRGQGFWHITWRQFRKNRWGMGGLIVIAFLAVVALFAPFLANDVPIYMTLDGEAFWFPNVIEYRELHERNLYNNFKNWEPAEGDTAIRALVPFSPLNQFLRERKEPPSARNWLGTDDRGRDVLARMIWGARISLTIGIISVGISLLIGVPLGALAGYYGGWVDTIISRLIEIMLSIPTFFLLLAAIAFLPPKLWIIMVVIGVLSWTGPARLTRGEFIKLRHRDFVLAARAAGISNARVMFRHILPNSLAPVLVNASFGVAGAILLESGLAFLGFGVQPPTPTWGELLKQSQELVASGVWWLVLFPGVAIFVTVTAFNLVGEALRDAMDPRFRE